MRDRFVGNALLLYGKPIIKIAALRSTDVDTSAEGVVTLRLGRGEIPLPEPLGALTLTLRDQQLARTGDQGWLLPGRHAGQHITADTLLRRLKRYGIDRIPEGRHAALLALAARLPAPILAERIGIHQGRPRNGCGSLGAPTPTTSPVETQDEPRGGGRHEPDAASPRAAARVPDAGLEYCGQPLGLVLTTASVLVLPGLATAKLKLAAPLHSLALRGDGVLSLAGAALAAATLTSLLLDTSFGWWWSDTVAALMIAATLLREGLRTARG